MGFVILIMYILLGLVGDGIRQRQGFRFRDFESQITINGPWVTHYNRQYIRPLRDIIEGLYITAHINTTLINKPTLGQITHCPCFYYRFKSF